MSKCMHTDNIWGMSMEENFDRFLGWGLGRILVLYCFSTLKEAIMRKRCHPSHQKLKVIKRSKGAASV